MEFFYFLVTGLISSLIFNIIFKGLLRSRINPFTSIQTFMDNLKVKKYVKLVVIFAVILIFTIISENYKAGYFIRGVILGFLISFIDVIFKKPGR